jgi:hypothetical protein
MTKEKIFALALQAGFITRFRVANFREFIGDDIDLLQFAELIEEVILAEQEMPRGKS